jgi:pimeloyl-ACP methyl ester carboxylesterase
MEKSASNGSDANPLSARAADPAPTFMIKALRARRALLFSCLLTAVASSSQAALDSSDTGAEAVERPTGDAVSIESSDGVRIAGSLTMPRSSKNLAPAALLVHDAGSERTEFNALVSRLAKQGFAVLTIDLRGHGESVSEACNWAACEDDAARERLWAYAARDVQAAASWLASQDGVHATSLSILGHRAGSTLATRYAVSDESVRDLVLIDPPAEQLGFQLARDLGELGGLPTYIVAPRDELQTSKRMANLAHEANNGNEFVIVSASREKPGEVLRDRGLPAEVSKWMIDQAMPRRGR